jgi:hypothetical protein
MTSPSLNTFEVPNTEPDFSLFFGSPEPEVNTSQHASIPHSPYIRTVNSNGSVTFRIDPTIAQPDVCKMAEAMPPLLGSGRPLTAGEDEMVKYYQMLAGVPRYVCGPNADNAPVLSDLYLDEQMVIDAGARALMEEAQAVLLETRRDGMFVYEEQMRMV